MRPQAETMRTEEQWRGRHEEVGTMSSWPREAGPEDTHGTGQAETSNGAFMWSVIALPGYNSSEPAQSRLTLLIKIPGFCVVYSGPIQQRVNNPPIKILL